MITVFKLQRDWQICQNGLTLYYARNKTLLRSEMAFRTVPTHFTPLAVYQQLTSQHLRAPHTTRMHSWCHASIFHSNLASTIFMTDFAGRASWHKGYLLRIAKLTRQWNRRFSLRENDGHDFVQWWLLVWLQTTANTLIYVYVKCCVYGDNTIQID